MLDTRGTAVPALVHWGADLGSLSEHQLTSLADSRTRAVGPSSIDSPFRLSLMPTLADGWSGLPGIEGRHDGRGRRPVLRLEGEVESTSSAFTVTLVDDADGDPVLRVVIEAHFDDSGVLHSRSRVTNLADSSFELVGLATVLPVPPVASERLDFAGAWAAERLPQRAAIQYSTALRESRHGRGGHDDAMLTVAGSAGFGFRAGEVWAVHLAWSGDKRTWVERSAIGATTLGAAELIAPGEVRLESGDEYCTPWALAAWSDRGLDGVSARLHKTFRRLPAHPSSPRPLTINTWEAVYFDHGLDRLAALTDLAAEVGVERFVLDDGWMTGRTDDTRALGDWTVDPISWSSGLAPLIERVRAAGMQFGLWVEPEMVSLDSTLARQHPEWIVRDASDRLPLSWRHQYVLDLSIDEAREYVRDALFALVDEYQIDYLKWDMNRDLLGGSSRAQTRAMYGLLGEIRQRYPSLEIESCSSGGARIDAGILEYVQRVWPSDTNDAHDRIAIMRWTSLLLPLEYLGSHVGSAPAHTTGRSQSLSFRLATALFGHAGIEWDLAAASPAERESLRTWAAAYRELRSVLHTGQVVRSDEPGDPVVSGVVSEDQSEAVFLVACLESAHESTRAARRLPGLDASRNYHISVVDVGAEAAIYWGRSPPWIATGVTLPGSVLGSFGLELPMLRPDEAIVLRVSDALAPAGPGTLKAIPLSVK